MEDFREALEEAARIETCATPNCDLCFIRKQAVSEGAKIALKASMACQNDADIDELWDILEEFDSESLRHQKA